MTCVNKEAYLKEVKKIMKNPKIREMRHYSVHGSSTVLHHSLSVVKYSYRIAELLHVKVNEKELARGAMLHDFYQYSYKESEISAWEHGTGHARRALENASKEYDLTGKEKNIIKSHMWPLTPRDIPRCRESLIVGLADKLSAVQERSAQIIHRIRKLK